MGAALSNSSEMRATMNQDGSSHRSIDDASCRSAAAQSSAMRTESIALTTGVIYVDQGSPEAIHVMETANEELGVEGKKDELTPPQVQGGFLNNAEGVHIEGSPTLISASSYSNVYNSNVYNTIVQPDVSERGAQLSISASDYHSRKIPMLS
ncbi:hypothetical protein FA15DRAFT_667850, partial [Coprinopsis marcescibilis]